MRTLQAALRGKIGIRHNKAPVHHIVPDRLQEEAFSTAILSDDEAEGSSAFRNDGYIMQEGFDFVFPADGNIRQPDARHYAAFQGIQHRL